MNKKILIVRGDRQNAKALSFLLSGSGYHISAPASAGEAVEAARHHRFDLAITDQALPENQPDLGLVANLKEAQPSLPIFFLAEEENLETVISCIRAGVTEVINNPGDLKQLIETTNTFLSEERAEAENSRVTWEDIVEVERMLDATIHSSGDLLNAGPANSAANEELQGKLDEALISRDRVSGELAEALTALEKNKRVIEELRAERGDGATDTEIAERASELDERERRLKELSGKIASQKVEVETQLAELEAQQIEFEESKKDGVAGGEIDSVALEARLDEERAKFTTQKLDLEARIQDLQREIEVAKNKANGTQELEGQLASLREELQDAKELVAEKDFIIQQRDREIEGLKSDVETKASNLQVEELEDAKRLLEVERHKLKERIDQLEIEKRLFEESHSKNQREIQVERRDAEISLREMQNTIKEEQLKLKVDQATLKEELRQFEQARQNFQEDVQELQTKQAELRKMEAYLQQMEESIKANGLLAETALPKPDSGALEPASFHSTEELSPAPQATETGEPAPDSPKAEGEPAKKPESWGKPDLDKKAGRGPLRIGRRSSF